VNLAHIRSAVPEIFRTQTKQSQAVPKTEPYAVVGDAPACALFGGFAVKRKYAPNVE